MAHFDAEIASSPDVDQGAGGRTGHAGSMDKFFFGLRDWAALGVVGSGRSRQCMDCRAHGPNEVACTGFGAGCFLPHANEASAPDEPRPVSSTRRPPGAR
jgi:hypothetical protein